MARRGAFTYVLLVFCVHEARCDADHKNIRSKGVTFGVPVATSCHLRTIQLNGPAFSLQWTAYELAFFRCLYEKYGQWTDGPIILSTHTNFPYVTCYVTHLLIVSSVFHWFFPHDIVTYYFLSNRSIR